MATNTKLVLICGESGSGKSASLQNIKNQNKWYYLCTEANKPLPFKSNFQEFTIEDPMQVFEAFDHGKDDPNCEGIIIDSLTFLMDMFESQYVLTSSNTMKGWSDYNQYFKMIMQDKVIKFNKPTIFIAHVGKAYSEETLDTITSVPVKGALKEKGIEAYFSIIVMARSMNITKLADFKSDMLTITEDEEIEGLKYVFQTRKTKDTTNTRIRGPMGLFSRNETYINNDAQLLLDKLETYYKRG